MRFGLLAMIFFFVLAGWARGQEEPVKPIMAQADAHWKRRAEEPHVEQAAALYQQVFENDLEAYEASWRLARCYWWLADHRDQTRRQEHLQLGQASAARAVAADPGGVEGHYWLGACAGLLASEKRDFGSLRLVELAIREMETVIRLEPGHGMAQYTLGVIYRQAPGWPFSVGNLQKSLEYARRAVELRPDVVLTHIGLAETLAALGRKEEARRVLEKAQNLPGPTGQEPETEDQKCQLRQLLRQLS